MSNPACHDMRQSLGVYVVGALDPAERMLVDLHLAGCRECREELAGLAGLPALLGRVPARDAERVILESAELRDLEEPPAELLARLLKEVAARRATGRWRGILAAAAAVIFAIASGVAGAHFLIPGSHGQPAPIAAEVVSASNPITGVSATISYRPVSWGTAMDVKVSGVPAGTSCTMWAVKADGTRFAAGSWNVPYGPGQAEYPASSALQEKDVTSFQIWSGHQELLNIPTT
jgi:putative zinc finger protein